ncbi:NADH-quinone oxidoreductase subunit C [Sphingobacterium psychroaquaticum]|nr:NADH-quinone oxidoreductase subunit C [Sphingobacterium psychroaquaticum]
MMDKVIELITAHVGDAAIVAVERNGLQPAIQVSPFFLRSIAKLLRDSEGFYFDFLANISAVDHYPENRFSVVYHITSIPYQTQLVLKVDVENERTMDKLPEVPSVSKVWRTADWHEREAFDLMGVFFTDHPDLRRILLPDDWVGFPLRKDYQDPETYHGISIK